MKKRRNVIKILIAIIILITVVLAVGIKISQRLDIQYYKLEIVNEQQEIVIMHISDLHMPKNGICLNKIIEAVEEESPDLVFITGDIIDSQTQEDELVGLQPLLYMLGQKTKCFAILGNHEKINPYLNKYKTMLQINNITLLENAYQKISIYDKEIVIVGINDNASYDTKSISNSVDINNDDTIILLAHRPELWKEYTSSDMPIPLLTLSGHAHGGQFRLLGKGIYSPNQGYFPRYSNGLYSQDTSYMIVSRGLGDSVMPIRLYNSYHLPIIKIMI